MESRHVSGTAILLLHLAIVSITPYITLGNASSLHELLSERDTLSASHGLGASLPPNLRRQALILCSKKVIISLVRMYRYRRDKEGQHTQPVLDELLLDRAGRAVSHDLEEGRHLAPTEAVGQLG
jgi:hypothetical protein